MASCVCCTFWSYRDDNAPPPSLSLSLNLSPSVPLFLSSSLPYCVSSSRYLFIAHATSVQTKWNTGPPIFPSPLPLVAVRSHRDGARRESRNSPARHPCRRSRQRVHGRRRGDYDVRKQQARQQLHVCVWGDEQEEACRRRGGGGGAAVPCVGGASSGDPVEGVN